MNDKGTTLSAENGVEAASGPASDPVFGKHLRDTAIDVIYRWP